MKQDRHRARLEQPAITLSVSTPGFVLGLAGGGTSPPPPPIGSFLLLADGVSYFLLADGTSKLELA